MKLIQKTNRDRLFYNFRLLILILFTVYGMMQRIAPLEPLCKMHIFPAIMLLSSALYLIWDFFTRGCLFKSRYIWILVGFLAATFLSSLLNIKYGVYSNAVLLVYMAVEYFILYQTDPQRAKSSVMRDIKVIGYLVSIISLIFTLISYYTYFLFLDYKYFLDGKVYEQGYQTAYRRVWGFYLEPNYQGLTCILVILFSLCCIIKSKKIWVKLFHIVNAILHFGLLVACGSRSAQVALFAAAFFAGIYFSRALVRKKRWTGIRELLIRLGIGTTAMVICFGILKGTAVGLPYLQLAVVKSVPPSVRYNSARLITSIYRLGGREVTFQTPKLPTKGAGTLFFIDSRDDEFTLQEIERLDIEEKGDVSNGRIDIWRDGFQFFAKRPIFGVSPSNRAEYAIQNEMEVSDRIKDDLSLHNGYLEVLVGSGIFGTAILGAFLVLCLIKFFRYDRLKKNGKNWTTVGFMLTALAAMMTFILFLSDIFYRKTIYAYLFWLILGTVIYLIEKDAEGQKEQVPYAFVCETPLHLLNTVNFVVNTEENLKGKCDLYLYHQFADSDRLSDRLKASGLFRQVYDFSPYSPKQNRLQKAATFVHLLQPMRYLKRHCQNKWKNDCTYEHLMLGYFTMFSDHLRQVFPEARPVLIEDGIGSYYIDDLEKTARSRPLALINRYFLGRRLSYLPETIYLNSPAYRPGDRYKVQRLEPLCRENPALPFLKEFFAYRPETRYAAHKIIYLTQPLKEITPKANAIEEKVLSLLPPDDFLVRVHPRQDKQQYDQFVQDESNNIWELISADQITDDHLLIGAFSTAQFSPKMIFDKEPQLLFLYQIYGGFPNTEPLIECLKRAYRSPEKIMVPKNLDELQQILNSFK